MNTHGSRMVGKPEPEPRGFALIVTISMMILLALLAVGLLSLSTVSMRSSTRGLAQAEAQANARLALQIAIGELQKSLGDDRRITANGSILNDSEQPHALGVWESWSPRMIERPTASGPDYDEEKESRFVGWMASGNEEERSRLDWASSPVQEGSSVELFNESADGYSMRAEAVNIESSQRQGSMAWAVSQEATKAKITVGGPEIDDRLPNNDLEAQPRPSLANNEYFEEPDGDWNKRAAKILDLNQAELDKDLWKGPASIESGAHFTTKGAGLLTNVIDGGLKTDMSLGFGMSESAFNSESWSGGDETLQNPFHGASVDSFSIPGAYDNQRPLYRPLQDSGNFEVQKKYWPANVHYHFPIASVPTFHSLRSYYRMPYHLYETDSGLTVFERPNDHVATKPENVDGGFYPPPSATNEGIETQMGVRPILDRTMFLISGGMSSTDELRVVITPVITMWNPYNVALEIEGSVAHIWIDLPYDFTWKTYGSDGNLVSNEYMYMSGLMGKQFNNEGHARSVDPYFFAAITATGQPLGTSGRSPTIRFEPGEVRVFAPAEQELMDFDVAGSIRERTLFLRPVDSLDQFTTRGGLSIPTKNFVRNEGFIRKLERDQTAQITFGANDFQNGDYPFYITLEDATRAKGRNPGTEDRGQAITDVLAQNFSQSGEVVEFKSPRLPYGRLKREPFPIGVLESYHRVAKDGGDAQIADLVYTGNPRQPWMNPFITNTQFKTGPQYQIRMRAVSSFNGVLQSANQGRSAFYGATQTPTGGRTHLSFFEVPSAPMLSLAGFQHADLSATPFAPANQFANSWASAYVPSSLAGETALEVDHSYLLNESLWDGWFFSGAAPTLSHTSNSGGADIWDSSAARISRSVETVIEEFFEDPITNPLRNSRMRPADTIEDTGELVDSLTAPAGCLKIAGELMVDGAFNVNSTSVEAWKSVLSGLHGATFDVERESTTHTGTTPFPRFRDPVGEAEDDWQGYRTLSDSEVEALAIELVEEVRKRGPFLSLSEFVNRRISGDDLSIRGALQEAIDRSELNESALVSSFSTDSYEASSQDNITPNDTAVGIPGYLTQADVLKSIAPVISVRSDTFTVRSYGDSKDASGNIIAKAWAEATVQRFPEFIESSDKPHTPIDELGEINQRFGRRLRVTSFRFISDAELRG
ncbi:hypothetical protein [Haloferula sp.]|uniref:hypothetical protein n=1 Tax=Haloferula sp. TaxID=2497595 RepID=UPI00329C6837